MLSTLASVQWLGCTHKQKGKSPEMKIIANIAYVGVGGSVLEANGFGERE